MTPTRFMFYCPNCGHFHYFLDTLGYFVKSKCVCGALIDVLNGLFSKEFCVETKYVESDNKNTELLILNLKPDTWIHWDEGKEYENNLIKMDNKDYNRCDICLEILADNDYICWYCDKRICKSCKEIDITYWMDTFDSGELESISKTECGNHDINGYTRLNHCSKLY